LDEATVSALAAAADSIGASTTVGSTTRIPAVEGVPGSSVVLVGLGSPDPEATDETLRRAAGAAARACRGLGTALVTLAADRPDAVALGAGLGSFRPAKVTEKDDDENSDADALRILTEGDATGPWPGQPPSPSAWAWPATWSTPR